MSMIEGSVEHANMSLSLVAPGRGEEEKRNKSKPVSRRATCLPTHTEDMIQALNASGLAALVSPTTNLSSRAVASCCVLVAWHCRRCPHSAAAAPQLAALARVLVGRVPVYAVDASVESSMNSRYGVAGTPSLLLFHNGHSVASFNYTSYAPDTLLAFLRAHTNYTDHFNFTVIDADYTGPSPLALTPLPSPPHLVRLAWAFLVLMALHRASRTRVWRGLVDSLRLTWREAEQHQHRE